MAGVRWHEHHGPLGTLQCTFRLHSPHAAASLPRSLLRIFELCLTTLIHSVTNMLLEQGLSYRLLKQFTVGAVTTSTGKMFHTLNYIHHTNFEKVLS